MTYLITGATGDVGARVVQHLLERGVRPRILARNEAKARAVVGDKGLKVAAGTWVVQVGKRKFARVHLTL